jgi:hypothetical protein
MSLSNMTPRFRAEDEGDRTVSLKFTDDEVTLERCCQEPIKRNSVLEGFRTKRFDTNQECKESRVDDIRDRLEE